MFDDENMSQKIEEKRGKNEKKMEKRLKYPKYNNKRLKCICLK